MAAYLVEAGLVLVVAPWTAVWQRNIFGYWLPWLGSAMSNEYVRGAVSGVGIVTIIAGLRDLTGAFLSAPAPAPVAPPAPAPPDDAPKAS